MVGGFDMWYQQAGSPLVDKFLKLGGKVCANATEATKGEIWVHSFLMFPAQPSFSDFPCNVWL